MKYGELNLGQIEAVVNKLGGMDGVHRLLANELTIQAVASSWPVWKTITIGGVLPSELTGHLERHGFRLSQWAREMTAKLSTAKKQHKVSLVRVAVKDLGFTEMPTTTELFARAKEKGLGLCPAEVGPHLRLALADQSRGDYFWVAMEPITDSAGSPLVFYLASHDGGQWLDSRCASPVSRWRLGREFVFLLRK